MSTPTVAMVLAAGLGTRMRPLTDDRPKALVEVGGLPLIDHMLLRLAEAGVERAVVNVHAFADRLIAHLGRRRCGLDLVVNDERAHPLPLETGGGIKFARAHLGDAPFLVANIDSVWLEDAEPPARAITELCAGFDPERMTARLLLAEMKRTTGFDGAGDFHMDEAGRLIWRSTAGTPTAPLNYMGVHIVDPGLLYAHPEVAFALPAHWRAWAAAGRLHGAVMQGDWMHVGDPAARDEAERRLASAGPRLRAAG